MGENEDEVISHYNITQFFSGNMFLFRKWTFKVFLS